MNRFKESLINELDRRFAERESSRKTPATRKLRVSALGVLQEDPCGAHVTYTYQGRLLLGTVTGLRLDKAEGERIRVLTVRFFNGKPWPVDPFFLSVDVLERS